MCWGWRGTPVCQSRSGVTAVIRGTVRSPWSEQDQLGPTGQCPWRWAQSLLQGGFKSPNPFIGGNRVGLLTAARTKRHEAGFSACSPEPPRPGRCRARCGPSVHDGQAHERLRGGWGEVAERTHAEARQSSDPETLGLRPHSLRRPRWAQPQSPHQENGESSLATIR